MDASAEDLEYFDALFESGEELWRRYGVKPDVDGLRVLDAGSGQGALCIDLARRGADVVGIDIDREAIEWAEAITEERYPELRPRLSFVLGDLADLGPDESFDLAISKDTLEHVEDVPAFLHHVHRLLKPGGVFWAAFSPLYWSPNGDHGRTGLPTGLHAVLPPPLVLRAASRHNGRTISSLADLGLNGMTPAVFRRHVAASPFELRSIAWNRGDSRVLRLLDRARGLPGLERWLTVSVYAQLVRPA